MVVITVGAEGWTTLPMAWRVAFELAWESLLAGSPPVGAVVVGPNGEIVGRGRSRRAEATASRPTKLPPLTLSSSPENSSPADG